MRIRCYTRGQHITAITSGAREPGVWTSATISWWSARTQERRDKGAPWLARMRDVIMTTGLQPDTGRWWWLSRDLMMTSSSLVTLALVASLSLSLHVSASARNYRTRKMAGAGCGLACYRWTIFIWLWVLENVHENKYHCCIFSYNKCLVSSSSSSEGNLR